MNTVGGLGNGVEDELAWCAVRAAVGVLDSSVVSLAWSCLTNCTVPFTVVVRRVSVVVIVGVLVIYGTDDDGACHVSRCGEVCAVEVMLLVESWSSRKLGFGGASGRMSLTECFDVSVDPDPAVPDGLMVFVCG